MIIVFANSKGGCGKTVSTIFTAEEYASQGKSVLVVDLDHQTNATSFYLGIDAVEENIMTLLTKKHKPEKVIRKIKSGLDIMPGSLRLIQYDQLLKAPRKEPLLYAALKDVFDQYDYVLVDTHPDMASPQRSALFMADKIICPVIVGDRWNLDGLDLLIREVAELKTLPLARHADENNIYVLPTQAYFSLADWRGLKTLKENFAECTVLPKIRHNRNVKHCLYERSIDKSPLKKDYKTALEVLNG